MQYRHKEIVMVNQSIRDGINTKYPFVHVRQHPDMKDEIFLSGSKEEYKDLWLGGKGKTLEEAIKNVFKSFEKKTKHIKSNAIFWKLFPRHKVKDKKHLFHMHFLLRVDNG